MPEGKLPNNIYCTGCALCERVCPSQAIKLKQDREGFLYPEVEGSKCVGCNICTKSCPVLNRAEARTPLICYAAKAKDDDIRQQSSSGGIFTLLARRKFEKGGVVFGAGYEQNSWRIIHKQASNEEELAELRGSKYVQSDLRSIFTSVKQSLEEQKTVLFSGTPCQVAAIQHYLYSSLGKKIAEVCNRLLLVEVVCHATPSPLVWQKYLTTRIAKEGEGNKLKSVFFRNKKYGWRKFSMLLKFEKQKEYISDLNKDSFLRGFLRELFNRPSCHHCPFRELRSGADLSLADFWNIEGMFPEMNDDKGISLVLVNSSKGQQALMKIEQGLILEETDYSHAKYINPAIVRSTMPHQNRDEFFKNLDNEDFDHLVTRMTKPTLVEIIQKKCKYIRAKLGVIKRKVLS